MADVEQVGDALALRGILGEAVHAPPVVEILRDIEMRKQPRILEHIADAAAIRRDVQPRGGVVERFAVKGMTPRSGFSSPAIMLISDVLPAPDAPNRPVTRPSLVKEAESANSPSCFATSTRSMVSSRAGVWSRAARTIPRRPARRSRCTIETTTSRSAAVSPSGRLDQRIDRR